MIKIRSNAPGRIDLGVVTTPDIEALIAANSPIAIGVSGGKDSCALAFATIAHLDSIGHNGPRVLVHSDLGRVEWQDSLPTCERLASALGVELVVVRREAGDMMDRWLQRWRDNCARYANLECVKLILPWSTPDMRFCTSELKTAIICRDLVRRFPGKRIVSCAGIRREESPKRKKSPIAKEQNKLTSSPRKRENATSGIDWNPIIEWTERDVFAYLSAKSFALHEAYTKFNMSRVSCAFCIMSNAADLVASASCPDNVPVYCEMVDLEIVSTFAFQGAAWLGDVAPQHLSTAQIEGLAKAKGRAEKRELAESRIPDRLLFEEGWPNVMPTDEEAEVIAAMRSEVAELIGMAVRYTDRSSVLARYADLMAEKEAKGKKKADAEARKAARTAKEEA